MIFNEVVQDLGDPHEERMHVIVHEAAVSTPDRSMALELGVALVSSRRDAPSWRECRAAVPGFVTGRYMGVR